MSYFTECGTGELLYLVYKYAMPPCLELHRQLTPMTTQQARARELDVGLLFKHPYCQNCSVFLIMRVKIPPPFQSHTEHTHKNLVICGGRWGVSPLHYSYRILLTPFKLKPVDLSCKIQTLQRSGFVLCRALEHCILHPTSLE